MLIFRKYILALTIIFACLSLSAQERANLSAKSLNEDLKELSEKLGFEICAQDTVHLSLFETAADWLGVRYRWGGNSRTGVDCSGFTRVLYSLLFDKTIDHSSNSLSKTVPVKISSPDKLKPGDMVFFATSKKHKKINHVGVYLKDGFFVHASSAKKKVLVSTLLDGFYKKAWRMGGRYN